MNEQFETVRGFIKTVCDLYPAASELVDGMGAEDALAKIEAEHERVATGEPVGWIFKIIVDKHLTGPARDGQIQIAGVWGTPSSHLYFSPDPPISQWVWWQSPVYAAVPEQENDALRARVEQLKVALRAARPGILAIVLESDLSSDDPLGYGSVMQQIDTALAATEPKEPAQPPLPTPSDTEMLDWLEENATRPESGHPHVGIPVPFGMDLRDAIRAALLSRIPQGEENKG